MVARIAGRAGSRSGRSSRSRCSWSRTPCSSRRRETFPSLTSAVVVFVGDAVALGAPWLMARTRRVASRFFSAVVLLPLARTCSTTGRSSRRWDRTADSRPTLDPASLDTVSAMEQRSLGSLRVSIAGLGCNNFGMRVDHDTSVAIVHRALDRGITMFDTADIYGSGRSEQWLGEALAGVRDDVVIATKFGWPDTRGTGLTSSDAATSVEHSLQRLATDRIDLLYVHQPDLGEPIDVTLEKLDALVARGKVREVGCSNVTAEHMRAADDAADAARAPAVRVRGGAVQPAVAQARAGSPAHVRSSWACTSCRSSRSPNGLLTGKYRLDEIPSPETRLGWVLQRGMTGESVDMDTDAARSVLATAMNWHPHEKDDVDLDVVADLQALAETSGRTMVELALGWLAAHPQIPSVIAGATFPIRSLRMPPRPNVG